MALPESLVKNYKKFQAPNGVPVFLKGGPLDKGLFGVTVALCGVGLISVFHMIYVMGFTKRK